LKNVVDQNIEAIKERTRMKIAIALIVAAVLSNILYLWYAKRSDNTKSGESSAFTKGYLNTPEVKQLKKSTAAELGLSIEELDLMLAKEVKQMAKEKGLATIG
jgi:hypothetical protein